MTGQAAGEVLAAISNGDTLARFVGGCVRDAVLGRCASDIDIATPLAPDEVMKRLRAAGLKAVPTGIAHGTVTAVAQGQPFEITTLRVDVETDGRHAVVAFTDDWRADALRRDFTMNALSADPDGTVHDYVGGIDDALAGRVRFVGDPEQRIAEDVLRLLRFFRFLAHYGRFPAEEAALAACVAFAPQISALSGERIRVELFKLLSAPDPCPVWQLMADKGIAARIIGVAGNLRVLQGLVPLEDPADPVRRLAALLVAPGAEPNRARYDAHEETQADGDSAVGRSDALAGRLRLSNAERERLLAMMANRAAVGPDVDCAGMRALVYRCGQIQAEDVLMVTQAARPWPGARFQELLAVARGWQPPTLPIGGEDLLDLGLSPGPEVGEVLRAVEAWWVAGDFRADREACLADARARATAG